jgi:hypothetical protein
MGIRLPITPFEINYQAHSNTDNGHEVDPPPFVFGGSNFLVGYFVVSPLVFMVL